MKTIDLHTHTHFSDGGLSPTELIKSASFGELAAIAITDHDTIEGLKEAKEAADEFAIELVEGVEFSSDFSEDFSPHILGYFLDTKNKKLIDYLSGKKTERDEIVKRICEKFEGIGYKVNFSEIRSKYVGNLGRPHVAVEIINNKENAPKLREDFGTQIDTVGPIFDRYLGSDCEFYKSLQVGEKVAAKFVIDLIHECGGLSVLAHPIWDLVFLRGSNISFWGDENVRMLREWGLDGIEAISFRENDQITRKSIDYYTQFAARLGMFITGGSDFHGFGNAGKSLGLKEENILIDYQILASMKSKLGVV